MTVLNSSGACQKFRAETGTVPIYVIITLCLRRFFGTGTGNVAKVWGSGTYPVQYTDDDYGRKTGMRTWEDRGTVYQTIDLRRAWGWGKDAQAPTANSYQANSLNQYSTVNAQALTYDLDGNLTEDATRSYTYDGENRLVAVMPRAPVEGDKKAAFAYDYMGRRVVKESYAYQASAWVKTDETRYLYDGWNMIRELDASGATKRSYVWGIDLSGTLQGAGGIGGLLASIDLSAATLTHYYFDGNGNVGQLVDATGAATAHYEYDPFGNVTYASGDKAASNPYRFSTKYHDDETTLVYYGYRYYSPETGRWVNRDPMEEAGGLNLYGFVGNDPVGKLDYLGMWLSSTHSSLTENSWDMLKLPTDMQTYSDRILADVQKFNVDTDSAPLDAELGLHFNRTRNALPSDGKTEYAKSIANTLKNFDASIKAATQQNCKKAIEEMGRVSHSWQDYYGHAVSMNYFPGYADKLIGDIEGDPDNPGPNIKPSSWGGKFDRGEHGPTHLWQTIEPGERAPDTFDRLRQARIFVFGKFQDMANRWWTACSCYAPVIYP